MTFARTVFVIAGVWGIFVLSPLFFLFDITGRRYAPPATYPHFFYGFLSVTMAWQLAFLVIAADPVRYRLLMLPAILEKLGYVAVIALLHRQTRIADSDALAALPDIILGALFIAAFLKTRRRRD